jgi:uncharacterized membrane protein YjjP (DUF1212 family)
MSEATEFRSRPWQQDAVDFALRVGEMLLGCGAGSSEAVSGMLDVARVLSLQRCEADITFSSLVLYWPGDEYTASITGVRVVRSRATDYTRVQRIHLLIDDLRAGRIALEQAQRSLKHMGQAPLRYPRWLDPPGWGVLSAAFTVLLGAGSVVAAVTFVATLVVHPLLTWGSKHRFPAFFVNVLGGALATVIAVSVQAGDPRAQVPLVVVGGIVPLLPGATLVAAVEDALVGFPVTAAARGLDAALLTVGIITGVGAVLYAVQRIGDPLPVDAGTIPAWPAPVQILAAVLVAMSFCFVGQGSPRAVAGAAATAAAGWAVYLLALDHGSPNVPAYATAAVAVGVLGQLLSRPARTHTAVFLVSGLLPLAPGITIYRAMLEISQGQGSTGLALLGQVIEIGLSLAAGGVFGRLISMVPAGTRVPYWRRRKSSLNEPVRNAHRALFAHEHDPH